jgi:hypothetical protein
MNAARVETTFEADGELHLTELPCRRGYKVDAIILILEQPSRPAPGAEREKARAAAVDQFLPLARSSSFRSDRNGDIPPPVRPATQDRTSPPKKWTRS